MTRERIVKNAAECPECHEVIESTHRHDFKYCGCGAIAVDGGTAYLRRLFKGKLPIDRSVVEEVEAQSLLPEVWEP